MNPARILTLALAASWLLAGSLSFAQPAALLSKAQAGDAEAQLELGGLYYLGDNGQNGQQGQGAGKVPQDLAKAAHWMRRAAEQGNATAQFNLGVMLEKGQGLPKDEAQAAQWYERAARQGELDAMANLGSLFSHGQGVAQDPVQAVQWYRRAAERGHAIAQYNLADKYAQGQGVPRDDAAAAEWYRRSAMGGFASGQYNWAVLLTEGRGVAQNHAEAVRWFRRAADQGDVDAAEYLGIAYAQGRGLKRDDARAVSWFRHAAERGQAGAQYNLGVMLDEGRGVAKNHAEAAAWWRKAAAQGHAEARSALAEQTPATRERHKDCVSTGDLDALYQEAIELLGKPAQDASLTQFVKANFSKFQIKPPAADEWSANVVQKACAMEFVFTRAGRLGEKGKAFQQAELVFSHIMFTPLLTGSRHANQPPIVKRWDIRRQDVPAMLGQPAWRSPHMKIDQWEINGLKLTLDFNPAESRIKMVTLGID